MHRLLALFLVSLLSACVAAGGTPAAGTAGASTPATDPSPAPQTTAPAAPAVDLSCRSDADCTVKDVGNCCGYYPACVNKDSPTDPAAVQAQCRASGRMSVCGFRQISQCTCNAGKCEAVTEPVGGWINNGPAIPAKSEESTE